MGDSTGKKILRGWLVFNGLFIDVIALFLLPVFFPAIAETIPWPNMETIFSGVNGEGVAIVMDSFETRMIANSFLFHGIVRASLGFFGGSTLGWLTAASYLCEAALFAVEFPHNTVSDPAPLVVCPVLAFFCWYCFVSAADKPKVV